MADQLAYLIDLSAGAVQMSVADYFENLVFGRTDMAPGGGCLAKQSFFNTVSDFDAAPLHFCLPQNQNTTAYKNSIKGFFHNEPCLYNHKIYEHAAIIYEAIKRCPSGGGQGVELKSVRRRKKNQSDPLTPKDDFKPPTNTFTSENEKRLSYTLVFQTLKCETFALIYTKLF